MKPFLNPSQAWIQAIRKAAGTCILRFGEIARCRARGRNKGERELDALTGVTEDFADQKSGMEPCFVGLVKTLRDLHTTASQLTDTVRTRAEGLRTALIQSRLAGEDGLASVCNRQLTRRLDQTASLLDSLGRVEELLRCFHGQVEGVRKIGLLLNVCTLSLAVESVRTPACLDAFGAFIGELRDLAERITRLGESIQSEVEQTQAAQASGVKTMTSGLEKMRSLAQDLGAKSQVTATEAQQLLDASCSMLQDAESCAAKVSCHAQEAVFHLQFGDIIRQQSEHILASLEEAVTLLKGRPSESTPESRTLAAGILTVQVSQIESITREVADAYQKLNASFEGISAGTQRFAESFDQSGQPGHSGVGLAPLNALLADAESLERLQAEGCGLSQQARAAAQSAMESLARLAEILNQVKAINHDMHLQALNAIIKTAALGTAGATLEVLAIEVDRLFRQSSEVVESITLTLEEILSCARETIAENGQVTGESAEQVGLRTELESISGAYAQFAETTSEVRSLAEGQQQQLALGQGQLKFLPRLAEVLGAQIDGLNQLRSELLPGHLNAAPISSATLQELGTRYTMASEREIHARAFGTATSTPAGAQPLLDSGPPLVKGDSEPLIGELASIPTGAPEKEKRQPVAPLVPVAPAANDLGDNVELF